MEHLRTYLTLSLLVIFIGISPRVQAQDTSSEISVGTPVNGQIGNGTFQIWTFNAVEGEVLSFITHATSGGLDPQMVISNNQGQWQITNDDYTYPTSPDALLEAITMPRTGTYTITVSGIGTTSGEYELKMLNGFSQIALDDNFNGDLQWQDITKSTNSTFTISADNGQLALALSGPDVSGTAVNQKQTPFSDFYVSTKVTVIGGQDGWTMGMALRQSSVDKYYMLNLNSKGEWRFIAQKNGTSTILRDWTIHPALANIKGTFTLAALVSGTGFDFFFNGLLFGRLSDTTLPDSGIIGFTVSTGSTLTSQTSAYFDDLVVTVPALDNGQLLIPQQIVLGQPANLTRDLQRRGLIPAQGKLSLTVPESFIESSRPGVERVPLARGVTYGNLAIGTTISWEAASPGMTGCGLILQSTDDTHYTLAYIDQTGAYGVSPRDGDQFSPGIYAELPTANGNKHTLIVILQKDQLLYYVDGTFAGKMPNKVVVGSVGNAVVNFDPIHTSCQFTDTWVWNWDN